MPSSLDLVPLKLSVFFFFFLSNNDFCLPLASRKWKKKKKEVNAKVSFLFGQFWWATSPFWWPPPYTFSQQWLQSLIHVFWYPIHNIRQKAQTPWVLCWLSSKSSNLEWKHNILKLVPFLMHARVRRLQWWRSFIYKGDSYDLSSRK